MTTRVGALCVENIISFYLHAGSIGRFPTLKSLVSYIKCYYKAKDSKMVIVLQWLYNFHENVGGLLGGGGGGGAKRMLPTPFQNYWGGLDPPPPISPSLAFAYYAYSKSSIFMPEFLEHRKPISN